MARTRAFEPEEILPKAMEVFWAKGFAETSIDDLVEATGVSRYGLYGEWGDKRGLFLATLDSYRDCQVGLLLRELERPEAGRQEIEDYFKLFAKVSSDGGGTWGCLLFNSGAEFGTEDADVTARVLAHMQRLERCFKRALTNARKNAEVPDSLDPTSAAVMLAGIGHSLALQMRAGQDPKKIKTFVKGALAILD